MLEVSFDGAGADGEVAGNFGVPFALRPSYHLVVSGLRKAVEDSALINPDSTPKDSDGGLAIANDTPSNGDAGPSNAIAVSGQEDNNGKETTTYQLDRWLYGSDGIRTRDLSLDRAACLAATPRPLVHA